jgi:hypothetical protein
VSLAAAEPAYAPPQHPLHLANTRRAPSSHDNDDEFMAAPSTTGALTVGGRGESMRFEDSFRAGSFRMGGDGAGLDSMPGPSDGVLSVVEEPSVEEAEEDPGVSDAGLSPSAAGAAAPGEWASAGGGFHPAGGRDAALEGGHPDDHDDDDDAVRRAIVESLAEAEAATSSPDDEGKSGAA